MSIQDQIEPGARDDGNEPVQTALESIAISLKRIADVLEGTDKRASFSDRIYTALETVSINIMHRRS
ncbi:hypothetical protein UFOVP28_86 [uncultured Caudovirales phage]|uniref:Uncharacterized protein n=1 Tax=uncultured Caudovirales phage TaxID=2100421 RepID=A0A6J5KRT7_9CAUD|nr:hypothetical protein UFOVP28_86 [uncultured Caudovirales phage]